MAGNDINKLDEFIRNLTGRDDNIAFANLSSAQKARVIAWADTNGISLNTGENADSPASLPELQAFTKHPLSAKSELAVGIDIQSCNELFPDRIKDLKGSDELLKIFTLREIAYAENKPDPYITLTGLFAAKEAIIKSNSLSPKKLNEIEIQFDKNGKPSFSQSEISISHSLDVAVAAAIAKVHSGNNKFGNMTQENEVLKPVQNIKNSEGKFNETTNYARRNVRLFRLLFVIILVVVLIGLAFSIGVNFDNFFK